MSGPQQVGGNQPLVGCFIPSKPVVPVNPVPAHQDQNHKKPTDCVIPAPAEENHKKPTDCVPADEPHKKPVDCDDNRGDTFDNRGNSGTMFNGRNQFTGNLNIGK